MTNPTPSEASLTALAAQVEAGSGISNRLDAEIEMALFRPPADGFVSVRQNNAASKLIYTDAAGKETTCWPMDWTMDRPRAAAALMALASNGGGEG